MRKSVAVRAVIHFTYDVEIAPQEDQDPDQLARDTFYGVDGNDLLDYMSKNKGRVDWEYDVVDVLDAEAK